MKNRIGQILLYPAIFCLACMTISWLMPEEELEASVTKEELREAIEYVEETKHSNVTELSKHVRINAYLSDDLITDEGSNGGEIIIYADEQKTNFSINEFIKYDRNATDLTITKIKEIHIPQLEKVRSAVGKPIIIRSASRTYEHEKKKGRSGKSQHIFPRGAGAVDISLSDYNDNALNELEVAIFENTNYNRVSRYKTYLHLDYATTRSGSRGYYRNSAYGWIWVGDIR